MRDHSHQSLDDTGRCAQCGQALPARAPRYGGQGNQRVGIAVAVLLHLLLVAIYLLQPKTDRHAAPPAGSLITYISTLPGKPKPKETASKASKPVKRVKTAPVQMARLPNTITLPHEKPVEVVQAEPKPVSVPPEADMSAAIEARRKARGQAQSDQPAEESEAERGNRLARANIAAANGRTHGDDANETGGVFGLSNRTFHSAEVKFRGWNPGFKRRWLQQVLVEQGGEVDLETAIVKKMIEMIRKEKTGDFEWDSHRLQRIVKLSARPQDTAELQAFLLKEMFPEYRTASR